MFGRFKERTVFKLYFSYWMYPKNVIWEKMCLFVCYSHKCFRVKLI